jgi:hypothetical protein
MHGRTCSALLLPTLLLLQACADDTTCPAGSTSVDGVCETTIDAATSDASLNGDGDNQEDGGSDSSTNPSIDAAAVFDSGPDAEATPQCFADEDHDGVGAGLPFDCNAGAPDASASSGADASRPAIAMTGDDCDDRDPDRSPAVAELCDGIDNDCDEQIDDNVKNACGGACTRPLDHAPGEACTNGLLGTCAREGTYLCQGDSNTVCSAPAIQPSGELCGDRKDNDCDGLTDEPDATNAPFWYQDCDGDGYAASTTGALQSCSKPAKAGSCTWTSVIPQPSTKSNWDCNDSSNAYRPTADYGTPPVGSFSWDLDCNGVLEPNPAYVSQPRKCYASVVAKFNGTSGGQCDFSTFPSSAGPFPTCYLWKDSNGVFVSSPTKACPDEPYEVSYDSTWDLCSITLTPEPAKWPCR